MVTETLLISTANELSKFMYDHENLPNTVHELEDMLQSPLLYADTSALLSVRYRLVKIAPDNWGYALDLVNALERSGNRFQADEIHRRLVLKYPDEFWIVYHWVLRAWNKGDFEEADRRIAPLSYLIQALPDEKKRDLGRHAYWLLGSLALKRHSFQEAAAYLQYACRISPDDEHLADLFERAGLYGEIRKRFGNPGLMGKTLEVKADYDALVINLDRDTKRFDKICHRFRDSPVDLIRVPGVYGSYLPSTILKELCRSSETPLAGSAGCFLTHIKAWEIASRGKHEVCLILEDDAFPLIELPSSYKSLGLPSDFDICFVNRRMEPVVDRDNLQRLDIPVISQEPFLKELPQMDAPGCDGYFLSSRGARNLLKMVERDGIIGDVDWRLIRYSMKSSVVNSASASMQSRLRSVDCEDSERLQAFSLFPCLVDIDTSYINSRVYENFRGADSDKG